MKKLEQMIENFFSKKEKILSKEDINGLIKEQFLFEAEFNPKKFLDYIQKFISRISSNQEFLINDNGEIKEAFIDPSFIETINSFKGDYLTAKSFFMPNGKYASVIPTLDGQKIKLNQIEKQTFTGRTVSPAVIKEGLAMYFYFLLGSSKDKKQVEGLVERLSTDKKTNFKLPEEINDNALLGPYGSSILEEVKQLNAGNFKNENTVLNAISCAIAMNKLKPASEKVIADRDAVYKQIRDVAKEVTGLQEPDKWNPSDVYLYNKTLVARIGEVLQSSKKSRLLVTTKLNGKEEAGLNELFAESIKDNIVGVSLKEEAAQGGKATGFVKNAAAILKGSDINVYQSEQKELILKLEKNQIKVDDKEIAAWKKKLNEQKKSAFSSLKSAGIKNINFDTGALNENNNLLFEEIKIMFESSLDLKKLIDREYRPTILSKIKNKEPFKLVNSDKTVILNPNIYSDLEKLGPRAEEIKKQFGKSVKFPTIDGQQIALSALDAEGLRGSKPTELPSAPAVGKPTATKPLATDESDFTQNRTLEELVKKYECYRYFQVLIEEFDKVKKINDVMSRYDNPLLALTAYAVGLSGFNPTFYKVQGNISAFNSGLESGEGNIVKFEGQDRLFLSSPKADLVDNAGYAGIKFTFTTEMGVSSKSAPKLFKTLLVFKYKGDAVLTVEVKEFKEQ